jgi:hypothetical protein
MMRVLRMITMATALLLATAATAAAATSPTITLHAATSLTTDSAQLNATINPGGSATSYDFLYGPTTALGDATPVAKTGAGTKPLAVAKTIKGLLPGTVYYFAVQASNGAGGTTTKLLSLKTKGAPPAGAQTGGATDISTSTAALTGVVNTEDTATSYYFEYGPTTSYGMETPPVLLAAGAAPVAVSAAITGLASGTIFHFQLIAVHEGISTPGGDQFLETYPNPAPKPRVSARTSPRSESGGPFTFTTNGTVHNNTATPGLFACSGMVTIRFFYGRRQIAIDRAALASNCKYSAVTTFAHEPGRGRHRGKEKLRIEQRFEGNGYLAASGAGKESVTVS